MSREKIDNSGQGNCMYYAYSISLMYFLHKKQDASTTEFVFSQLELTDIQKGQLCDLLNNKGITKYTDEQITTIIEPILAPAARRIAAKQTTADFLAHVQNNKPDATPVYTAANYGMVYLFRQEMEEHGDKSGVLEMCNFDNNNFITAEFYNVFKIISDILREHIWAEYDNIMQALNNGWEAAAITISQEQHNEYNARYGDRIAKAESLQSQRAQLANMNEDLTEIDKKIKNNQDALARTPKEPKEIEADNFYKRQFLEGLIGLKTVEFFTKNNNENLKKYETHLAINGVWGTEDTLLLLHRYLQGERPERIGEGYVVTYRHPIELRIDTDRGELPSDFKGPGMRLINHGNVHWSSEVEPLPGALEAHFKTSIETFEAKRVTPPKPQPKATTPAPTVTTYSSNEVSFTDLSLEIATFRAPVPSCFLPNMKCDYYGIVSLDKSTPLAAELDTSRYNLTAYQNSEPRVRRDALFTHDFVNQIPSGFLLIVGYEQGYPTGFTKKGTILGHCYWRCEDGEQIVVHISKLSTPIPGEHLFRALCVAGDRLLEVNPGTVRVTLQLSQYYPIAVKSRGYQESGGSEPSFDSPCTYPVINTKTLEVKQRLLAESPLLSEEQRLRFERNSVKFYPEVLPLVSIETQNNKELLKELIKKTPIAFCYFPDQFLIDPEFLSLAVESGYFKQHLYANNADFGAYYEPYTKAMIEADKKICKKICEQSESGRLFEIVSRCAFDFFNRCSDRLAGRVDLILSALNLEPKLIKFLPETYPEYRNVVREVFRNHLEVYYVLYGAYHWKHPVINSIVAEAISYEGFCTEVPRNEILSLRKIAILYYSKFPNLLEHCSKEIINNHEAMYQMIFLNGLVVLPYLPMRPDREDPRVMRLVSVAVKQNQDVYDLLPTEFQEALKREEHTGPQIRERIEEARNNYSNYHALPEELKEILKTQGFKPPEVPPLKPQAYAASYSAFYPPPRLEPHVLPSATVAPVPPSAYAGPSLDLRTATAEQKKNLYYVLACISNDHKHVHSLSHEMKSHPLIAYVILKNKPHSFDFLNDTNLGREMLKEKSAKFLARVPVEDRLNFVQVRIDTALLPLLSKTVEELVALSQTTTLSETSQPSGGGSVSI